MADVDQETVYTPPETEAQRQEKYRALLEEQMRLEEAALSSVRPAVTAEADALRKEWMQTKLGPYRQGLSLPTTERQEYAQGTVMPTSQGFMYVGNPLECSDSWKSVSHRTRSRTRSDVSPTIY